MRLLLFRPVQDVLKERTILIQEIILNEFLFCCEFIPLVLHSLRFNDRNQVLSYKYALFIQTYDIAQIESKRHKINRHQYAVGLYG